jgi:hypothetical protein
LAAPASAQGGDDHLSAICDTTVVVAEETTVARTGPYMGARPAGVIVRGQEYTCSAVTAGGEHRQCGAAVPNPSWLVIEYGGREVYVPTACTSDVY